MLLEGQARGMELEDKGLAAAGGHDGQTAFALGQGIEHLGLAGQKLMIANEGTLELSREPLQRKGAQRGLGRKGQSSLRQTGGEGCGLLGSSVLGSRRGKELFYELLVAGVLGLLVPEEDVPHHKLDF